MFFKKKTVKRSFDDVLSTLGSEKFDVAAAGEGANGKRPAGAYRVSKYGCAAEIAPAPAVDPKITALSASAAIVTRAGVVLNGQIAHILDRGYQKFLKTPKLEIVATADHLRALHKFSAELDEATGAATLYNESLGTTSDSYQYDRVKGREPHAEHSADPLQRSPTADGTEAASDL